MLYDHTQTNNLTELQVVTATSLLHRSIDNEIAMTAQNLRANNMIQNLSEELARVRNTDVAGLNATLAELQHKLNVVGSERDEALAQFGTVKQREGTLKEELRTLKASHQTLQNDYEVLKEQAPEPKAAAKTKKVPAR